MDKCRQLRVNFITKLSRARWACVRLASYWVLLRIWSSRFTRIRKVGSLLKGLTQSAPSLRLSIARQRIAMRRRLMHFMPIQQRIFLTTNSLINLCADFNHTFSACRSERVLDWMSSCHTILNGCLHLVNARLLRQSAITCILWVVLTTMSVKRLFEPKSMVIRSFGSASPTQALNQFKEDSVTHQFPSKTKSTPSAVALCSIKSDKFASVRTSWLSLTLMSAEWLNARRLVTRLVLARTTQQPSSRSQWSCMEDKLNQVCFTMRWSCAT